MISVGDTLTVKNDHITIGGDINLEFGQKNLITVDGYWCGDYWIPERIIGVKLVDHYDVYPPDCFNEKF